MRVETADIEKQRHKSRSGSPDHLLLTGLSEALWTSHGRMRLDGCRDWIIPGSRGHIFTDAKHWYVFVDAGGSKRRWTLVKDRLSFMVVRQDADDEGVLTLDRMPTPAEAATIRKIIGLRRRPTEAQGAEMALRLRHAAIEGGLKPDQASEPDQVSFGLQY